MLYILSIKTTKYAAYYALHTLFQNVLDIIQITIHESQSTSVSGVTVKSFSPTTKMGIVC